jgi:hypothetical protein
MTATLGGLTEAASNSADLIALETSLSCPLRSHLEANLVMFHEQLKIGQLHRMKPLGGLLHPQDSRKKQGTIRRVGLIVGTASRRQVKQFRYKLVSMRLAHARVPPKRAAKIGEIDPMKGMQSAFPPRVDPILIFLLSVSSHSKPGNFYQIPQSPCWPWACEFLSPLLHVSTP